MRPAAAVWVLTAHALALSVGTAVFGRLADTRGVRAVLLIGAVVLAAGAIICVASPSLGVLVAGRLVLAAGSGAMVASGAALLAAVEPHRRPRVLAGFGVVMAVFAADATLAGGAMTTWLTWRFTVILPVLSVVAVPFCLTLARRTGSGRPLDVTGAILLTVTASAFLVLIQARTLQLAIPVVLVLATCLVLAAAALVGWTRRRPEGFLPRELVGVRGFGAAVAIGVGVFGGLFATMYAVPQVLAHSDGWSALTIGVALLPGAAVGAVLSRTAGLLQERHGRRLLAATAFAASAALALAATGAGGSWVPVVAASLSLAAFAVTQITLTGEMSVRLPVHLRGIGMGLLNLTFFVGGATGSALTGALSGPMGMTHALAVVALFPLVAAAVALTGRADG